MNNILKEVTELTYNIENNYPELYRTLDENPMTLLATNNSNVDEDMMKNYLEGLKQILKKYVEIQKSK
jgi:hypothetical protein